MGGLRAIAISLVAISSIYAKVDITKINDICLNDSTNSCNYTPKEVKALKLILNYDLKIKMPINGKFDTLTKKAVMAFQKKHNLPMTGYVGPKTKLALDSVLNPNRVVKTKKEEPKLKKEESAPTIIKQKDMVASSKKKETLSKKDKKTQTKVAIKDKKNKKDQIAKKSTKTKEKVALKNKNPKKKITKKDTSIPKSYKEFRRKVNLRKSYAIFKDNNLLKMANRAKTILKVDVSEQRVKLLVNGKVALDAPCTTGSKHKFEPNTKTYRDKRTPLGTFTILEKIPNKRSTIFGKIYKNGKLVFKGDRRKYKGSWKGAKFVGAPLKNWMRITSNGIGLHASKYVKRYPGSNGCIRLPQSVANMLFSKVKKGTKVKIVN